jgi:3-hydroxyacyl-[acyl-carrier-protein] dehydratase
LQLTNNISQSSHGTKALKLELLYAADHPAAQGHFPGNPIIPGAVLLSDAAHAVATRLALDLTRCQFSVAKFPSPARPGDRVTVEISHLAERGARFSGSVDGRIVLTGALTCAAVSKQG